MDKSRPVAISWLLYSLREVFGLSSVRNIILKKVLENDSLVHYGQTFTQGDTFEDIYKLIDDFQGGSKKFLIFTANGEVKHGKKRGKFDYVESHYVSFV